MPNTDYTIRVKATDMASDTFAKIEAKGRTLGDRLKMLGQSFGNDRLSKLGEVTGKADGAGAGGLGTAAKLGGALFIDAQIGRTLSSVAQTINTIRADVKGTNADGWAITGELSRSLPLLGDMVKGFDDIRGAAGNVLLDLKSGGGFTGKVAGWGVGIRDTVAGALGYKKLKHSESEADTIQTAKEQEAAAAAYYGRRDRVISIVRDAREEADPTIKINREAEERRLIVRQTLASRIVSESQAAAAIAAIDEKAEKDLAAAREKADKDFNAGRIERAKATADKIVTIQRETAAVTVASVIGDLRRGGKDREADGAEIQAKYDGEREAIAAERSMLASLPPSADDAKLRAALDAREASVNKAESGDYIDAQTREGARREATADKIRRITRDTIGMQVGADDRIGQSMLKRLDIATQIRDKEKEIDDLIRTTTDPAQLAALKAARGSLSEALKTQLADVDRRPDVTIQGRQTAAAQDGRFQAAAIAQRSQVETFRDTSPKETAKNTADMRTLLEKMLAALNAGPTI